MKDGGLSLPENRHSDKCATKADFSQGKSYFWTSADPVHVTFGASQSVCVIQGSVHVEIYMFKLGFCCVDLAEACHRTKSLCPMPAI